MRHIIKFVRSDGTPIYIGNDHFDNRVKWVGNIADAFEFETTDALEMNIKLLLWWNEPYSDGDRQYELIHVDMPDIELLVNL